MKFFKEGDFVVSSHYSKEGLIGRISNKHPRFADRRYINWSDGTRYHYYFGLHLGMEEYIIKNLSVIDVSEKNTLISLMFKYPSLFR